MRRRDLLWSAAAVALSACTRKRSGPLQEIRFGVHPFPNMSVFYLALEKGYFREAGFDVRPHVVANSPQMANLLAAGHLDAACTFASPALFNAAADGAKLRIVLGREEVGSPCGDAGVVYMRRAAFPNGTSDIHQWAGKRFTIVSRASLGEFLLDTELASAGLDPAATPKTNLDHAAMTAAMLSGGMDAALNSGHVPYNFHGHPEIVREDAGIKVLAGTQFSHVCFGKSLVTLEPQIGGAILAAYLKAGRDFMAGAIPRFLTDYAASNGVETSEVAGCRTTFAANGEIDRKSLARIVAWSIGRGYTPPGTSADPLIDTRFWELAIRTGEKA